MICRFTGDDKNQLPVFPETSIFIYESKERCRDGLLPQLQDDWLAAPLAFAMLAEGLNEVNGILSFGIIVDILRILVIYFSVRCLNTRRTLSDTTICPDFMPP